MSRIVCVEVRWRDQVDGRVSDLLAQIHQLGLSTITGGHITNLYYLRGSFSAADVDLVCRELLVDPVVESSTWHPVEGAQRDSQPCIEVSFRAGVTDPVAQHLLVRSHLLGIEGVDAATTGTRYTFEGDFSASDLHTVAQEILCNDVIQTYSLGTMEPAFVPEAAPSDQVETIPLRSLDDSALQRLSRERVLFLSLAEMKAIQAEYQALGREPTDVELEILAQTWSEHCLHKTFKAEIDYECLGGSARTVPEGTALQPPYREHIPSLIHGYLKAATDRIARPWVRSAFVDNAGIIDFDDSYEVSFKVETHNHPSALEPFGGANTGTGGVIRDVIGVSAQPIAATDVLCFGPLDLPQAEVPQGSLHPRRIARGVVAGIEDYGNKMGIPTVSGAILYHKDYTANPLVYCGCVGLAPKGLHRTEAQAGDLCVALGGKTGRDGLHGATFSSAELTHDTGQTVGSVVQIGDPITEKAVLDAIIRARDEGLYTAITDCGAGGFSSAVGEMGKDVGVDVNLEAVPLKYPGLRPWEIWLSEAQERMVLAVPERQLERLGKLCEIYNVAWTVIGHFTGDKRLRVRYGEQVVADLPMAFIHEGWPRLTLSAVWAPPESKTPEIAPREDETPTLLRMLSDPDVASKEAVIRRYDHEVQGATVIKPLVGRECDGPADAPVLRPLATQGKRGIALGCGIAPSLGQLDPYAMAWAVIDEAIRNVVCAGADPDQVALLDNFCWGNPALADRLGGLVRAAQGCYDAAIAYGAPFISGKDSLNNEFVDARGQKRTIPPTLLISSIGIVPDVASAVTMDLKQAGDALYLVGETREELGGSLYYRLHGERGVRVPAPVPDALAILRRVHRAIQQGCITAIHDLSEGGVAVAAAEMAIAGRLGLELELAAVPKSAEVQSDQAALFAESSCRFLMEVAAEHAEAFEAVLRGAPCQRVGKVTEIPMVVIRGLEGTPVVHSPVAALVQAWQSADVA